MIFHKMFFGTPSRDDLPGVDAEISAWLAENGAKIEIVTILQSLTDHLFITMIYYKNLK